MHMWGGRVRGGEGPRAQISRSARRGCAAAWALSVVVCMGTACHQGKEAEGTAPKPVALQGTHGNWRIAVNDKGQKYWWNVKNKRVQWERPTAAQRLEG